MYSKDYYVCTRELTALAITRMPFHAVVVQTFARRNTIVRFLSTFAYLFIYSGKKRIIREKNSTIDGMEI